MMRRAVRRRACRVTGGFARTLWASLVLISLVETAGAQKLRSDEEALLRELRRRELDVETVVLPHALSPEMKEWLAGAVARESNDERLVAQLLEQLLDRSRLDLEYHQGYTGTAVETFETRQANCLAFTHLFVGMARELGVDVYYLKVEDLQSFEREGDLVVVSGHVTAGFGPRRKPRVLEFAIFPAADYRQIRLLSDLSAVALFYSNRGAELLLEGDREGALEWLETAVRIDENLADAWVNLGVVHRRLGDLDAAEIAYRKALVIDPDLTSAYQNLSSMLLKLDDRREEGQRLLALTDRSENRNPFNFIALGDLSLEQGRPKDAERYYRRALNLEPDSAESQAAIGQWFLDAGRPRRAKRWLKRARKIDPDNPRVARLAEQITEG